VADPTDAGAYPITSLTWLLLYPTYKDAAKKEALTSVIDWALTDGRKFSDDLGYIPLPGGVKGKVTEAVTKIQ
jgi:phosphate transport system substrate-binding protein